MKSKDRRLRPLGSENVELLDLGRTVGLAPWRTKALAREFAVALLPRQDLAPERRVDRLIVGGIQLNLIQVQPNTRAFCVRRWADVAFLRQRRRGCENCRRAKHAASRDRATGLTL